MSFVYLASPYTHADPQVRQRRYNDVVTAAAKLMQAGLVVFCPIAHSHPMDDYFDTPGDHDFWERQDAPFLHSCDHLVVLCIDGWECSRGVGHEIEVAVRRGIPIDYISLDNLDESRLAELRRAHDTSNVLDVANGLVHGDRNADYGHPLDDFSCNAAMWSALLTRKFGRPIELQPEDVGLMMVCVKLSREAGQHKLDNLVDGAGYFETINMVHQERRRRG